MVSVDMPIGGAIARGTMRTVLSDAKVNAINGSAGAMVSIMLAADATRVMLRAFDRQWSAQEEVPCDG